MLLNLKFIFFQSNIVYVKYLCLSEKGVFVEVKVFPKAFPCKSDPRRQQENQHQDIACLKTLTFLGIKDRIDCLLARNILLAFAVSTQLNRQKMLIYFCLE